MYIDKREGMSIVLRGDFNPAIFQPFWFAGHELISNEEAEAAKLELVHPEATVFTVDWLGINVVRDRLQIITKQDAYYEAVRDLTTNILELTSSPLTAIGINRDYHYRFEHEADWHEIGHKLAPKDIWEQVLDSPGTRNLTIEGKRTNDLPGYIQISVQPSREFQYGVYVTVNDHYEFDKEKKPLNTQEAIRILGECWTESMTKSESIAEMVAILGG